MLEQQEMQLDLLVSELEVVSGHVHTIETTGKGEVVLMARDEEGRLEEIATNDSAGKYGLLWIPAARSP